MLSARLALELEAVRETLARTDRAVLRGVAPDGLCYEVAFGVRTLVRGDDGVVREVEREVPVVYHLAPSHPVLAPIAVALEEDLFHPNIRDPRQPLPLPPIPLICLGAFRVEQRLADWLPATYYLLAYARITTGHGLNPEAVSWARRELTSGRFPIDRRPWSRR
jgi:hypothetical protein